MSDAISDHDKDKRDFLMSLRGKPGWRERGPSLCPEPRLLLAAHEGVLPEDLQSIVQTHIRDCGECRALRESFDEAQLPHVTGKQIKRLRARIRANLPGASAPSRKSSTWSFWMWRLAPVAASLLMIISLGVWYQQIQRDRYRPTEITAPAPSPAVELAAIVPLEPAPVELPLDALLVRRDSGADEHTLYIRKLALALAPYRIGGYAKAAPGLAQVAAAYPNAPEAQFYYGVCLLFIDQPGEAIQHLSKENLFAGTQWQRKGSWYLGIAYLRARNNAAAMHEFQRLCESEGETKESACEAVRLMLTVTPNPAGR